MDGMKTMLGQQNKQGLSGGLSGASLPTPPKFKFRMPSLPQAPGKPPVNKICKNGKQSNVIKADDGLP